MAITYTVRSNRIAELKSSMVKAAADDIAKAADSLAARAIAIAPQRTGSLVQSIYVSGPGNKTEYSERASAAFQRNRDAVIVNEITPKSVDPKVSERRPVAVIAPAVLHGLFIELGTRYMAPQPFLIPAAEAAFPELVRLMGNIADL